MVTYIKCQNIWQEDSAPVQGNQIVIAGFVFLNASDFTTYPTHSSKPKRSLLHFPTNLIIFLNELSLSLFSVMKYVLRSTF